METNSLTPPAAKLLVLALCLATAAATYLPSGQFAPARPWGTKQQRQPQYQTSPLLYPYLFQGYFRPNIQQVMQQAIQQRQENIQRYLDGLLQGVGGYSSTAQAQQEEGSDDQQQQATYADLQQGLQETLTNILDSVYGRVSTTQPQNEGDDEEVQDTTTAASAVTLSGTKPSTYDEGADDNSEEETTVAQGTPAPDTTSAGGDDDDEDDEAITIAPATSAPDATSAGGDDEDEDDDEATTIAPATSAPDAASAGGDDEDDDEATTTAPATSAPDATLAGGDDEDDDEATTIAPATSAPDAASAGGDDDDEDDDEATTIAPATSAPDATSAGGDDEDEDDDQATTIAPATSAPDAASPGGDDDDEDDDEATTIAPATSAPDATSAGGDDEDEDDDEATTIAPATSAPDATPAVGDEDDEDDDEATTIAPATSAPDTTPTGGDDDDEDDGEATTIAPDTTPVAVDDDDDDDDVEATTNAPVTYVPDTTQGVVDEDDDGEDDENGSPATEVIKTFFSPYDSSEEDSEEDSEEEKTTTASAATAAPITAPRDLCDGCDLRHGVGYNPHPSDCTLYIQCRADDDGKPVVAGVRSCPHGLYWNQDKLTCDFRQNVNCQDDICRAGTLRKTKASGASCRGYWDCSSGTALAKCCAVGFAYNAFTGRCNYDPKCTDDCLSSTKPFVAECPDSIRPVAGDLTKYEVRTGSKWTRMSCPANLGFTTRPCGCNVPLSPPIQQECVPELYLPFTTGTQDESGRGVWVKNEGVQVRDGKAYFDGSSRLTVPRFSNTEWGSTVYVHLRYKSGAASSQRLALVSNGDCQVLPSLAVCAGPSGVEFYAATEKSPHPANFTVPSFDQSYYGWQDGWQEVLYRLEDGALTGYANLNIDSRPAVGNLETRQRGLVIGSGGGCQDFTGFIDEVTIYFCRPVLK